MGFTRPRSFSRYKAGAPFIHDEVGVTWKWHLLILIMQGVHQARLGSGIGNTLLIWSGGLSEMKKKKIRAKHEKDTFLREKRVLPLSERNQ